MNKRLIFWSLTVSLAGFLFGFDTIVISGAETQLQKIWNSSDTFHGWVVVASALWGTVVGAIFGNIPTDKLGRKRTLFCIGILYSVSAIGSALANDPWTFSFFRLLGGIGVGISTIAAPAYISEIAPANNRGKLVALYQFNIVFGILIAFISNYFFAMIGDHAWRWMIGIETVPAILYTLMVLTIPMSPRWLLIHKKQREKAITILEMINPQIENINDMVEDIISHNRKIVPKTSIFSKKYFIPLSLAFFISFFNQFSGINAFLYYSPRIFESAGLGESTALLSSVGIGLINLIFTLIGLSLIDKYGRKRLLYIGSIGYIISLSLVAMAFVLRWEGILVPIFLFIFIAAHAIGQGTVIWVFISEIFPNHFRARGQAFGVSVHWVLAAIIPAMVPLLFSSIGPGLVFIFFTFMMILQLLWVWKYVPETKGISLEQLEKIIT